MMEEEWGMFREKVFEVGKDQCGIKKIREGMGIKGSEWRKEETRRVVERKKKFFLIWRRTRSEEDLYEYRIMEMVVKKIEREAKKRVKEECTLNIAENFKVNKKKRWKRVNEVRKGETLRLMYMKKS